MTPGTYTLVLELESPRTVSFGAAGERHLQSGWYAYTGSAFGPGGLSRVSRHRRVDSGENETRHWHIDYVLGLESATIRYVRTLVDQQVECVIAETIEGEPIDGIGATDCSCNSHLLYRADETELRKAVRDAYRDVHPTDH